MAMNLRHLSTQKLRRETITLLPLRPPRSDEEKEDDSLQSRENHSLKEPENGGDSDGSSYSSDGEQDEFIAVQLAEIQKEVQCPICLGIIRKTRTVMECLHRFCRECIDKAMRLGNNECPACRTHCASRRSLRDDPNFDALIAALYPDIEKYEEEELAFHEEEKARNKLIQDSIAQAFCRQAEVSGKKRSSAKPKKQGSYRNMKGPRNYRDGSDEEEVAHGHTGSRDSSSSDDHCAEVKSKRYKLLGAAVTSQPPSGANADDSGMNRELLGASVSLGSTEFLAWGGGGLRSNTRHGGSSSTNNRPSDSNRVARLIEHLQGGEERDKKNFKIHPLLVTLDEKSIPILEKRYFTCNPKWTVGFLCQEVAKKTSVEASKIEMLIVKDYHPVFNNMQRQLDPGFVNPSEYELQLLDEHLTMQEVLMTFCERNLVLGYRLKAKDEGK